MIRYILLSVFLLGILYLNAQSRGLLWEVKKDGEEPSYLFGTMHLGDKYAYAAASKATHYIEQCDGFAMEMLITDEMLNMGLLSELIMTDGTTMRSLFAEREYRILDSVVMATTGFSLSMLDHIQPIVLIGIAPSSGGGVADSAMLPLDLYLMNYAKERGKKLLGIETVEEQLRALQTLSYKEQAEMITLELNRNANSEAYGDSIGYFYAQGELDSLMSFNKRNPMPEKLEKALMDNRNVIMANRIAGFLQKQTLFIAIGALHLPGENGVIALLRKMGFTVEPVKD